MGQEMDRLRDAIAVRFKAPEHPSIYRHFPHYVTANQV